MQKGKATLQLLDSAASIVGSGHVVLLNRGEKSDHTVQKNPKLGICLLFHYLLIFAEDLFFPFSFLQQPNCLGIYFFKSSVVAWG